LEFRALHIGSVAFLDATAGVEIGDPYAAPPVPSSYLAATKKKSKKLRIAFATKRFSGESLDPEMQSSD
jgi:amidase